LILLSKGIEGDNPESTLGLLDCTVARNAYGRQVSSFREQGRVRLLNGQTEFEMVFIRAPRIRTLGPEATALGYRGEEPVMVRQGNILGLTFHPELADDDRIHGFFLSREFFRS
jgi:5'-phosphate synthase pdxT subunit